MEFTVNDMTCGHCASTITKALKEAAPWAEVQIALEHHKVIVRGEVDASLIEDTIRDAGFTPVRRET